MSHTVFISYSNIDKAAADAACATFEANGIRCWIAPRDIRPGAEWAEAIMAAIETAKVMVLIFSANSNESRQVRREIEVAVSRGLTIMPLRLEQVEPSRSMAYFMAGVHWIDALTPPLEAHLKTLVEYIKPHVEGGQPTPAPELPRPAGPPLGVEEARKLANEAVALANAGRQEQSIATYRALVERINAAPAPELDEYLALALYNLANRNSAIGRFEEAIALESELVRRFGDSTEPAMRERVVKAMLNHGVDLMNLHRYNDTIVVYDDLLHRFSADGGVEIAVHVGVARFARGVALAGLGRNEEAVAAYSEMVARADVAANPFLRRYVAMSLVNKGERLVALGRPEEALAALNETVSRFEDAVEPDLRDQVTKSLVSIGDILINLKRFDAGLAACERVIGAPTGTPVLEQHLAMAMHNKVVGLQGAGRKHEAGIAADQMLARFASSSDPAILDHAAAVRTLNAGLKLTAAGRASR